MPADARGARRGNPAEDARRPKQQLSDSTDQQESKPPRKQARVLASKNESKQGSKLTGAQDEAGSGGRTQTGSGVEPVPAITSEVWASVDRPATITNSFRYTDEEL